MSISFVVGYNDERLPLINGKYKRLSKNSSESEYLASPFLHEKLSIYRHVDNIYYYPVWIVNETFVVKMYLDRDLFEKALSIQRILSKDGIGCNVIDVWRNGHENFIVSAYGGTDLSSLYKLDDFSSLPPKILIKINCITKRLSALGFYMSDNHTGNYVMDTNGDVKIIDYESIDLL